MIELLLWACLLVMQLNDVCADGKADAQLSESANCFTLDFYKRLAETKSNLVSSPFSLDVLLSMLLVGSGGQTAEELRQALGYQNLNNEDMQNAFKSKLNSLTSSGGNKLSIANSIWIQKGFSVKQSYKDVVKEKFLSEENEVDFASDPHKATDMINSWSKKETNELIPVLFDEDLEPTTVLVLTNAIYFKGEWQYTFNKTLTQEGNFNNNGSSSKTSKVNYMKQQNRFRYHKTNEYELVEMNYTGGDMSMVIILPTASSSVEKLERSLVCDNFKNVLSSGNSRLVEVTIPRFDVTSDFDLKEPMKNSGIRRVFQNGANFSGITDDGIFVTKAVQKAVVKINEEGSEAAAVTAIVLGKSAQVIVKFKVDRPFLFLIYHKPTDLILFMGRVAEL